MEIFTFIAKKSKSLSTQIDDLKTILDLTGPEGLKSRPPSAARDRVAGGESSPQCGVAQVREPDS
jgi:hypothetical protein